MLFNGQAETISHTLSFAIVLLALNPEVQYKLREEVLRIWPTLDDELASTSKVDSDRLVCPLTLSYFRIISWLDIKEYTQAVFRETM